MFGITFASSKMLLKSYFLLTLVRNSFEGLKNFQESCPNNSKSKLLTLESKSSFSEAMPNRTLAFTMSTSLTCGKFCGILNFNFKKSNKNKI